MKKKDVFYIIGFILLIVVMRSGTKTTVDENVIHDTISYPYPVHDTIWRDNTRYVKIPADSVIVSGDDSCFIFPTDVKCYRDSTYEAWVSGVNPNLDSIHVFRNTVIRTITKSVPKYITIQPTKEKSLLFGGFVSAQSSFDLERFNVQGGLELQINRFSVKAGYNAGEHCYPFIGAEYKIR